MERETRRNLELIWLSGQLAPDLKATVDFGKNNGHAIRRVCREFVVVRRKPNLFADATAPALEQSRHQVSYRRDWIVHRSCQS